MSKLEDTLAFHVRAAGLPVPEREYPAIPGRRFRWDFAWPTFRLLLEVQGGTWVNGGHSRGAGVARDCEKHNLATLHGWRTLNVTTDQFRQGKALEWIKLALYEKTTARTVA